MGKWMTGETRSSSAQLHCVLRPPTLPLPSSVPRPPSPPLPPSSPVNFPVPPHHNLAATGCRRESSRAKRKIESSRSTTPVMKMTVSQLMKGRKSLLCPQLPVVSSSSTMNTLLIFLVTTECKDFTIDPASKMKRRCWRSMKKTLPPVRRGGGVLKKAAGENAPAQIVHYPLPRPPLPLHLAHHPHPDFCSLSYHHVTWLKSPPGLS